MVHHRKFGDKKFRSSLLKGLSLRIPRLSVMNQNFDRLSVPGYTKAAVNYCVPFFQLFFFLRTARITSTTAATGSAHSTAVMMYCMGISS